MCDLIQATNRDTFLDFFWAEYPGPVLNNWNELDAYLRGMTDRYSSLININAVCYLLSMCLAMLMLCR